MSLSHSLRSAVLFLLFITDTATGQAQRDELWTEEIRADYQTQLNRLKRNPADVEATFKIGGLLEKVWRWQDAVTAYDHTLQLKPDFAFAHYRRGWCLTNLRKYEDALKAQQQALKFAQNAYFKQQVSSAQAHYAIGWNMANLQRFNEAIEQHTLAGRADASLKEGRYEIGRVLLKQGKPKEALALAESLDNFLANLLRKEAELTDAETVRARLEADDEPILNMEKNRRPNPTHRETAKYTQMAREQRIQGTVVLAIVFFSDGKLGGYRIERDLPYGLTAQALIAAEKFRFKPASEDGKSVSVRGTLEFDFTLY
jgi:TonB family protein